jgi:SAM-dependent methyltransferase
MALSNPYDELPYRSAPIEWSAPERLALTSLLHGGPRPPDQGYRLLELGCGNGANLLPLAFFRPHGRFIGVDAAASAIALARGRTAELGLRNVKFMVADFREAARQLEGPFDYIVCHGVFSWIDDDARDALVALCAEQLALRGLLYVNYNARPGWDIRAMVRRHLLETTDAAPGLRARAEQAQHVAGRLVSSLAESPHPYRQLMVNEYRIVAEADTSYVAHEYLAPHNHAYWRSEFLAIMKRAGLELVADADFNHPSGRLVPGLAERLDSEGLAGASADDTLDMLSYRQLHSPILMRAGAPRRSTDAAEMSALRMVSCLAPKAKEASPWPAFVHPTGYEVEARDAAMEAALRALHASWPEGKRLDALFADVAGVFDDLLLLYRNGLIDLRLGSTPDEAAFDTLPLHRLERSWGGYRTAAHHACGRCDVGH